MDFDRAPNSSTGLFELIHKESLVPLPRVDPKTLQLDGESIPKTHMHFANNKCNEKLILNETTARQPLDLQNTKNYLTYVSKDLKDSLLKLLNIIQGEKEKRQRVHKENASENEILGEKKTSNGKSDKNIGNSTTRLNEIFTQTFNETTDELTKHLDADTRKSYFNIKNEFKEIFIHKDESNKTNSPNVDKTGKSGTNSLVSIYQTPNESQEKITDIFNKNPECVFHEVSQLLGNIKNLIYASDSK